MTLPPPIDWPEAGMGQGQDLPAERRVTRENWRIYPFSRWGFQHTRELVPSRALRPSPSPRALAVQTAALDQLCFDDEADQVITWAEFERRTYCDAMLIHWQGAIIHESYRNGMTPATPHHSFSVSKSFVGLLAEMLIADGTLDGLLPFEFTRLYRTSAVENDVGLGFGWSHSLAHCLEFDGDVVVWVDHENRRTRFPLPSVERPATWK